MLQLPEAMSEFLQAQMSSLMPRSSAASCNRAKMARRRSAERFWIGYTAPRITA